jgi:transcriptional regulator with XRE-family HTH domain
MSTPSNKGIAADLRRAIARAERRGLTRYAIAKAAKMPQSQLTRVANGDTVPTLTTAERIAEAISHRLTIVAK